MRKKIDDFNKEFVNRVKQRVGNDQHGLERLDIKKIKHIMQGEDTNPHKEVIETLITEILEESETELARLNDIYFHGKAIELLQKSDDVYKELAKYICKHKKWSIQNLSQSPMNSLNVPPQVQNSTVDRTNH